MSEKGATAMDKGAHKLMEFWMNESAKTYDDARYKATYHEDMLYSVYDEAQKQVTLVYAKSPKEAIVKAKRRW